jgi:membrane protein required for colicin V production
MRGANGLDYAIVAILAVGVLYGLTRGVLRMVTSILSVILGIAAASAWYGRAGSFIAQHLNTTPATGAVIGYIGIFIAIAAAVEFAGRRVVGLAHIINLNWLDRLAGALCGAALAAAFAGFDIGLLTLVLPGDATLVRNSQLAPRMLAYNQMLMAHVPADLRNLYGQKRDELLRYWNNPNESPAPPNHGTASGT